MNNEAPQNSFTSESIIDEEFQQENQAANLIYTLPEISSLDSTRGRLFLGGKEAAKNLEYLIQKEIHAVLTMASSAFIQYDDKLNINHKCIDALDTTTYNILNDFEDSFNFIDQNLQKTNLLVHCEKGISRSPTIVIAYLMKKQKKISSDVLLNVREKRKEVEPNGGFYYCLGKYCEYLRKENHEEQQKHENSNNHNKPGEKKLLNLRKSEIVEQMLHE